MTDPDEALEDLGRFIRAQREISQLSLRHLARLTNVSDSYLSQVERGLYQPSPDVLRSIAEGLGLAPDQLYRRMGWFSPEEGEEGPDVVSVIRSDPRLSQAQKSALIQTYKAMVGDP